MTRFARDTAVEPGGAPGVWAARCDGGWFTPRGPNGGYVAAIVLRAMLAELAAREQGERSPRSLSLHYLRPPAVGAMTVTVSVERSGRSLTSLSARLEQDGKPCVLALGAFAVDFSPAAAYADPRPGAVPFAEAEPVAGREDMPSMFHRFELRPAVGHLPFSGADEALSGGWVSFAEGPVELDAPALAALADVWLPTAWVRMTTFAAAPTVDLTVHFRAPEVLAAEPVLAVFRSRFAHGGFFEEDGEIWTPDGVLLAQSRQLALLMPA